MAKLSKPAETRHDRLDRQMDDRGRLPDGSSFLCSYNADVKLWEGALSMVVGVGGAEETEVFTGVSPGIFGLMRMLDDKYRAFLAELASAEAQSPAPA